MKIYVASSWRNEYQPKVVQMLLAEGHFVYDFRNPEEGNNGFAWSDIDPNWENWTSEEYVKALSHPLAEKGYMFDFNAMNWADCCVMVLPCGRSANTEAGYMKGEGKPVFVYQPIEQEPELMYKIYDDIILSEQELVCALITKEQEIENSLLSGIQLITQEREEQISKHNRSVAKDAELNKFDQLTKGAQILSNIHYDTDYAKPDCPIGWNLEIWLKMVNKPYNERLAIAGALLAAELDRIIYLKDKFNEDIKKA